MRGGVLFLLALLTSGCLSTLGLQPVHLARPGRPTFAADLSLHGVDDRLVMPFPMLTATISSAIDTQTDVAVRLGAVGVGVTLRRALTDPEGTGPTLLLQAGGTGSAVPDYAWANLLVGRRLGVPFGPGSTRDTSHLILDLRLEGHGVSAFCTGTCGGVSLGFGFSTGVALRLVPGAWITLEAGLHRPLTDFGSGRWVESVGLAGVVPGEAVFDGGLSVRFDGDLSLGPSR